MQLNEKRKIIMARGIDTLYTQEGEKVTISKTGGGKIGYRG